MMLKHRRYILLIIVIILINSCVYIPTPEHGDGIVPDEAMDFLVPGETNRADVILRFGDPIQRLEEDRFFLYHWKLIDGYIIAWGGMGAPTEDLNYLCMEFTHENLLKRWKHFEGGFWFNHPEKQIMEWMKDKELTPK